MKINQKSEKFWSSFILLLLILSILKDDIEIVFVNSNCENSEEKTLNNENESENEEIASNSSDTVNSADLESHSWNSSQDSIHTIEARISEVFIKNLMLSQLMSIFRIPQ